MFCGGRRSSAPALELGRRLATVSVRARQKSVAALERTQSATEIIAELNRSADEQGLLRELLSARLGLSTQKSALYRNLDCGFACGE